MDKYGATVSTRIDGLKIVQETRYGNDPVSDIIRTVMDTAEAQTRQALIDLGWTPPAPTTVRDPRQQPIFDSTQELLYGTVPESHTHMNMQGQTWNANALQPWEPGATGDGYVEAMGMRVRLCQTCGHGPTAQRVPGIRGQSRYAVYCTRTVECSAAYPYKCLPTFGEAVQLWNTAQEKA